MLDLKGKSLSEFINENKTLKLVINYINFKKQAVYAKPYKEPKDKEIYPPYELGQIIEGKVFKVLPYGIRIRNEDGRNTLIHKSQLQKQGYGDFEFELSQSVTIKKSGYDEEHNKDIWDIISPIVQTEEDTQ
jgi:polyribonucleotide nucleotidyltransferase